MLSPMDDTKTILTKLAEQLSYRGLNVGGPYPGREAGRDYLLLDDGKYMEAERDDNGRWEALIHAGSRSKGVRRVPVANMGVVEDEGSPNHPAAG